MSILLINQITYPFFIIAILISILGYGNILNYFFGINNFFYKVKNLIFIQGLILISFFCLIINFFIPITNNLTILIILLGIIFYLISFFKMLSKQREIIFISLTIFITFILTFYAGVNDDYNYHYDTIKNFKSKNIFEIIHHNRISYNSHWLFLNSIFIIEYLTPTIFILSGLLYAITIHDSYHLFKKSLKKKFYYTGVISFFFLIFLLGVLNNFRDIGTDVPGVIISYYIIIIISYYIFDNKIEKVNYLLILILLLATFVFVIKITNSLIFLYILLFFYSSRISLSDFKYIILVFLIPLLWMFQNINISGCLIWPIELTCFQNSELAIKEIGVIEAFAKGNVNLNIKNISDISWINIWFQNHSVKILETYFAYFILMLAPLIYFFISQIKQKKIFRNDFLSIIKNKEYKILFLLILISNLVWFFYSPAYRFGIFYNLTLIIFILLPFWIIILQNNFLFIYKYSKVLLFIIFTYFIFENITKVNWYLERYDIWPPIINNEIILRK